MAFYRAAYTEVLKILPFLDRTLFAKTYWHFLWRWTHRLLRFQQSALRIYHYQHHQTKRRFWTQIQDNQTQGVPHRKQLSFYWNSMWNRSKSLQNCKYMNCYKSKDYFSVQLSWWSLQALLKGQTINCALAVIKPRGTGPKKLESIDWEWFSPSIQQKPWGTVTYDWLDPFVLITSPSKPTTRLIKHESGFLGEINETISPLWTLNSLTAQRFRST